VRPRGASVTTAYHLLARQTSYRDLGPDYYDRRHAERVRNRAIHTLERPASGAPRDSRTGSLSARSGNGDFRCGPWPGNRPQEMISRILRLPGYGICGWELDESADSEEGARAVSRAARCTRIARIVLAAGRIRTSGARCTLNQSMPSKTIIRTYLLLTSLYTLSASLIWGVNTLFLLQKGRLDIFEVFVVNAIFAAAMALFEVPTGLIADTRGRRLSFLLSLAVLLAGTLGYTAAAAVGGGVVLFAAMSIVLGLGFTFYSGAMEAWLVDALKSTGFAGVLDRVFAGAALTSGAAMVVGSVGGGLLGTIDLSIPYLVRALLLASVFAIGFVGMRDLGFSPRALGARTLRIEMASIARASLYYGWQHPSVRLLILASSTLALFSSWGFYAWQPYFLALAGRDAPWITGILAAVISIAGMAGNAVVEWFARYCGRRTTLLAWAVSIHAVAALGVGLASSFWAAVLLYLLVNAAVGVFQPVKQAYLHQVTLRHSERHSPHSTRWCRTARARPARWRSAISRARSRSLLATWSAAR
jgi:MFS family permease